MLSINATLAERIQYDLANVSPDELHDAALALEEWRQLADCPEDVQEQIDELEAWRDIRINGMQHGYKSAEHFEQRIGEYVEFFSDVVSTVEEYYGSFMGTAEPYNFHQHIAEEFEAHDAAKATLANIREAIKNGESVEYIASLLED